MTHPPALPRPLPRPVRLAALAVVCLAAAACGDDPFEVRWTADPDTVLLYSLARPELNLPSAFNFLLRVAVPVESPNATGNWDVAVDTEDDRIVLLPPGALHIDSRAAIAVIPGVDFDDVREAPGDIDLYVTDEAVPVATGSVYVVQTHQSAGTFGRRCVYYAKVEPIEIDVVLGTLRFLFDANPVCNDTRLVPPDD